MNPSARKKLFRLLEAFEKSETERSDLEKLEIDELEYGTSLIIRFRKGALRKGIHVIIGPRGGFKHAEREMNDLLEDDRKTSRIWASLESYLERF